MFDTLISAPQLAQRLGEASLAVLDCRFDLTRPQWGEQAYAEAHIPGALYAHLERDLSGTPSSATGRHPLPSPASLAESFGRWGIGAHTQVVAYDQGPGAYAARLWWLLRWMGHERAAVLDGGLAAWEARALPLERGGPAAATTPCRFYGQPDPRMLARTEEIEQAVASGRLERREILLIDARGADRFAGENETLDPIAGHIPGAGKLPFAANLEGGSFLPPAMLRRRFLQALAGRAPESAICMCGSGVTACHNLLALSVAGLSGARLYAGSWSEWIRDPRRPVTRGA